MDAVAEFFPSVGMETPSSTTKRFKLQPWERSMMKRATFSWSVITFCLFIKSSTRYTLFLWDKAPSRFGTGSQAHRGTLFAHLPASTRIKIFHKVFDMFCAARRGKRKREMFPASNRFRQSLGALASFPQRVCAMAVKCS